MTTKNVLGHHSHYAVHPGDPVKDRSMIFLSTEEPPGFQDKLVTDCGMNQETYLALGAGP